MKYAPRALTAALITGLGGLGLFALQACSGDDSTPAPAKDASSDAPSASDATTADGGSSDSGSADGASSDSSVDAAGEAGPAASFITHLDGGAGQLPEGLWLLGDAGTPLIGLAPLAVLETVGPDGSTQPFGGIGAPGSASNSFTLGITTDTAGSVYVGVGVGTSPDAGNVPAPGIYKFAADGGGALFSATAGMNFPNGLDFVGNQLFVADSDGVIYSIAPNGTPAVWSSDPLLAPDPTACDGGVPLGIGANGIVHDSTNFYVTNTNHGRVIKIPMQSDGGAGAAAAIVDDCSLVGADGLVLDPTSNSLIVAVNVKNEIVRVSLAGQTTVLASGAPLHSPASVVIESTDAGRRLLFTNATFFAGTGDPGLLELSIP
jgi:sugar lactone lactonase YvrE